MPIDTGDGTISETAPDSGVFELEMSIAYDSGPDRGLPAGLTAVSCKETYSTWYTPTSPTRQAARTP